MLDDNNILKQRDPNGALEIVGSQYEQAKFDVDLQNPDNDGRKIQNIVIAGMGGSALAALVANAWLRPQIDVSIDIVRTYNLPAYVGENTLVIASSYSGNTEETLSCFEQAKEKDAQIAIIAASGKLTEFAQEGNITFAKLPEGLQPRMALIYNLRALISLLVCFGVVGKEKFDEIAEAADWLKGECSNWAPEVPTSRNYAKQLAEKSVGKTAVFYGGTLSAPAAYKWKISWNENAKNVAFWNELPEFNHNEFIGWISHPVEKPFVVFDIISSFDHPRIHKRFEISDRLLSGMRPKSTTIELAGDSIIKQLLWSSILADYTSIYLAILNNVNPTPVQLIEKLKQELA